MIYPLLSTEKKERKIYCIILIQTNIITKKNVKFKICKKKKRKNPTKLNCYP